MKYRFLSSSTSLDTWRRIIDRNQWVTWHYNNQLWRVKQVSAGVQTVPQLMTYVFIGESRSRSRLFLLSKIFLTWTYHKQKWQMQILGLKLSQNRSQDRFGTWYVHVIEIFDKRKKPEKNWLSIADQPVFDRKFDNKHTCTVRSQWSPIILKCISCCTAYYKNNI